VIKNILLQLLQRDPKKRLALSAVMNHDWVQRHIEEATEGEDTKTKE
jgi:hypothetical protein